MSVAVSTWAWKLKLSPNRKLVLLALADHSDDDGESWVKIKLLLRKTQLSRATLYRCLNDLKRANLLTETGSRWILTVRRDVSQRDTDSHSETPIDGEPSKEPSKEPSVVSAQQLWKHYANLMHVRRPMNDDDRRVLRAALIVASPAECRLAIYGCSRSDFHMKRGDYENRTGPKYNKLSQILRGKRGGKTTREQIEMFIEVARQNPAPKSQEQGARTVHDPEMEAEAKRVIGRG